MPRAAVKHGAAGAALAAAVLLGTAASAATPDAGMQDIARRYIALILGVGQHEPGYVDAYYGPADLAEQVKAMPKTVAELKAEAEQLLARLEAEAKTAKPDDVAAKRIRFLTGQIKAARARLDMIGGKRLPFADEAEALFGVRPELKPLSSFDPILAQIDKLVPGDGPLHERVERFRAQYIVPKDKLDAVMRAATAECKRRTAAHIKLPEGERFTLSFVTDKPWSGYNWYKGNGASLIEINVDQPVFIDRAIDLGCHEGYPGHHTYNALIEQRLVKARGWPEFTVTPLFSPRAIISEGSANFGIELAFPGRERLDYEQKVLFPLAGLDPKTAPALAELQRLTDALMSARYTIAAEYLAGKINREEAVRLSQKYRLLTRGLAERDVKFMDTYRSYVINYGLGKEMVRAHVNGAGKSRKARWAAMEEILSEPAVPADLK